MSVPAEVRTSIRTRLWNLADDAGWLHLSNNERSRKYDQWTEDPGIGGVLSRFVDQAQVRVYIKDTLLNGYMQHALADSSRALRVLRIPATTLVQSEYSKPHGLLLGDGRLISWGHARDWRFILMSLHERAHGACDRRIYAAVLLGAKGRFAEDNFRYIVDAARVKLGIENLVWLEA